jgi:spermidine synthase
MSCRPPYLSLALLSATALSYEILLMRLFSIIQWHHFAYLVIALALLGYGISGSLLWLAQRALLAHYREVYFSAILLFAIGLPFCFLLAQAIPFNIEELFWDLSQVGRLSLIFLLLALPFLFAAGAICLTFMAYPDEQTGSIYALDLLGAGVGSLCVIGLMYLQLPEQILITLGLGGLIAGQLALWELRLAKIRQLTAILLLIALGMTILAPRVELTLSPYKGLAQTLRIQGTRIIETRSSPLGYLSVVASEGIPLRHAPGLSFVADTLPPAQLGLFTDADNMTAISAAPESVESLAYLDQTTAALPYHLKTPNRLLVIGSGTGNDLHLARYHAVSKIDALELNPQVTDLLNERFRDYAGPVYHAPGIRLHIAEARDFLAQSSQRYDLIQIALLDAAAASASGLYALNESYLYTREAMRAYLSHLAPDGYLAITRWIKLPPRDSLKLFATTVQALEDLGVSDASQHLVLIRSWQTGTLLVKNGQFNHGELQAIEGFCRRYLFDRSFAPGLKKEQSNRYNQLSEPLFFSATQALAGDGAERFLREYKFNIEPATDDRPYFHHFFKWGSFLEALALRGEGGLSLIEWGYVILLASLAVSLLFGALAILFPLVWLRRSSKETTQAIHPTWVVLYFFAIGLAFLFLEIAFIQRFVRFLHHPIYAIAISLTAFLIFAGFGSRTCRPLSNRLGRLRLAGVALAGIGFTSLLYLLGLDWLFEALSQHHLLIKSLLSLLLIAPLAFLMGLPFPLAMTLLRAHENALVPWAWGVNGYASVISASLATLIAIHYGFTVVVVSALLIYLLAWALLLRMHAGLPRVCE